MKKQRIYVAGPMTVGQDERGVDIVPKKRMDAFWTASRILYNLGWEVINPALEKHNNPNMTRKEALKNGVAKLITCQAIALLPGWEKSEGVVVHELPIALKYELVIYCL